MKDRMILLFGIAALAVVSLYTMNDAKSDANMKRLANESSGRVVMQSSTH